MVEDVEKIRSRLERKPLPESELPAQRQIDLGSAESAQGISSQIPLHRPTLNSKNGLPRDTVHWVMEDDNRFFWLYMACGLVRIARPGVGRVGH